MIYRLGFLVLLSLAACKSTSKYTHVMDMDGQYLYANKENRAYDQEMDDFIAPFRAELAKEMEVVLIQNQIPLVKDRPNCNLGIWIADLLHDFCNDQNLNIDFAVQNQGGLRKNSLGKGNLTVGNIYEVMPFENMLVIIEGDGSLVQTFCDHIAASNGWPLSYGLSFEIKDNKAVNIVVNGQDLKVDQTYRFAVPDYIAKGGSDCSFFKGKSFYDTGRLIRDIMIEDTRKKGASGEMLNIKTQERIRG